MLELRHLSKQYRNIRAVDDVSFTIHPGEIVGYLGPNGSGKSTTVKMIVGLLEPTRGLVLFEGHDIHEHLIDYKRQLGYVPEEPHIYTHLSAMEYLQLVGRLRSMPEDVIEAKSVAMLRLLSLEAFANTEIASYSKGMKQRVLIAAALLHDPELLIFDEPLSGLDVASARLFKDLLQELANAGKAILYISHVLEIVERICTRVLIIYQGKIQADASIAQLTTLTQLPTLEHVFAHLVKQEDTQSIAKDILDVMRKPHARY